MHPQRHRQPAQPRLLDQRRHLGRAGQRLPAQGGDRAPRVDHAVAGQALGVGDLVGEAWVGAGALGQQPRPFQLHREPGLAFVLWSDLGTRAVTRARFALPLLLVAVAAWFFLRDLPNLGNDLRLELAGAGVGAVLGLAAAALIRVGRDAEGRLVMRAGAAYAALWIAVIGGRVLFAYGAEYWFPAAIGRFSMTHEISGAAAWTAAFVLMALVMVVVRVAASAALALRARRAA
nr:hypothetical protein GCM10020063_048960 [Dactylosporangium thailandense]